ncbi:hypothetical protein JXA32_01750 [Candidatus Sumerlaeota bacterium]|nr:hypothetical protein [Candidatus Sumerlaeota bacterium]
MKTVLHDHPSRKQKNIAAAEWIELMSMPVQTRTLNEKTTPQTDSTTGADKLDWFAEFLMFSIQCLDREGAAQLALQQGFADRSLTVAALIIMVHRK